jgi:predicted RNA-binding protein
MIKRYWIAVASKEHVEIGKKEGIAQVCHGKFNPLKKMKLGDWILYYSPTHDFSRKMPCRAFTAIGKVQDEQPYQQRVRADFVPWRRAIEYSPSQDVAIEPLLEKLSFIKNKQKWGFLFRFGLFSIPYHDFKLIAFHMGVFIDEEH